MSGWKNVHDPYMAFERPPYQDPIWIFRPEWDEPKLVTMKDLHPMMNIWGLMWTLAVDGDGPPETHSLTSPKPKE